MINSNIPYRKQSRKPSVRAYLTALACLMWSILPVSAKADGILKGTIGVNLAGAEFSPKPGVFGKTYLYPTRDELRYYKSKGMRLFRIPLSWDRLQPDLSAPLDASEMARVDAVVSAAHEQKVKLILDLHNYDRYRGTLIGSDAELERSFAKIWKELAQRYRAEKAIYGYGLMNEPHDTHGTWPHTAQCAINAIRSVDGDHFILLAGDEWSGATKWEVNNPRLLEVKDPAKRVIYEAHTYWDRDGSGVYKHTYDEDKVYPEIGVDRVRPFVEWLKANKAHGLIGEFGVPGGDPRWNEALDRFLVYLRHNDVSATYWAGGPIWHHYILSCEPSSGVEAPQMSVLSKHARSRRSRFSVLSNIFH